MTAISDILPPAEDELVTVVGPTASGKTALAMDLAEAWGGEIVSADSVQIYRHFDIGSGKPTGAERARVPHHLVDCIDPLEPFDAAHFAQLADAALLDVRSRGKVPVVCGGTFLWIRALLHGLAPSAPRDSAIRQRHVDRIEREGREALHAELAAVDAESAERLAPNDFVRVSRALEVYELTGRTQAQWHREHGFRPVRHRARLLGVERSREELDERIARRACGWLEQGWLEEVARLRARGYGEARAMASVGYRQVREHLDGELPECELQVAIVRATRTFVRRQRTWLRDQPVQWVRT